jgi:hypothetical protein
VLPLAFEWWRHRGADDAETENEKGAQARA